MAIEEIDNWVDERRFTEFGAVGLSILMAHEFLKFKRFRESAQGTGYDYKVTVDAEEPEVGFLEISGIRKESKGNTISMRVQQKRKQIGIDRNKNVTQWISVVEFFTPKSKIIKNEK